MKNKILIAAILGVLVGCGGEPGAPEPEPSRQIEGRWGAKDTSRTTVILQVGDDLSCRLTVWEGYAGEKEKIPCAISVKPNEAEITAGQGPAVYRLAEAYSLDMDGESGSLNVYVDDEDGEEFAAIFEPGDSIFDLDDSFRFDRVPDAMETISAVVLTAEKEGVTAEMKRCALDVFAGVSTDLQDLMAEIYDERFERGPESLYREAAGLVSTMVDECGFEL